MPQVWRDGDLLVKISVVTSEPGTRESVGTYEWRTDPAEAEKAFRSLRSLDSITRLWHDVEVNDGLTPEEITAHVDYLYWDCASSTMGEPAKTYIGPEVGEGEGYCTICREPTDEVGPKRLCAYHRDHSHV